MKKLNLTIILAFICQLVFAQIHLKLNLETGKTYTQEVTSKIKMDQKIMGMDVNTTMDVIQNLKFKPIKFENDVYTLETSFERLSTTSSIMGREIIMDGNGDLSNPMNKIFGNILHKPFQVLMTTKGVIKQIIGLDSVFSTMTDGIDMPDVQKDMIKKSLIENLNADALSNQINIAGLIFPDKNINVGDSWSNNFKSSSKGINLDFTATYTLKEINPSYVICDYIAQTKAQENTDAPQGTIKGELKIDPKSGWTISNQGDQTLKGTFSIENPMDPSAGEIQFYMDMSSQYQMNGHQK